MQAITVAIGPNGISFFAQQLVITEMISRLKNAQPPDRSISVPDFSTRAGTSSYQYSNINIKLTGGSLSNFNPAFQSLVQQANGLFQLNLLADNFDANYSWNEAYCLLIIWSGDKSGGEDRSHPNNNFNYYPHFGSLTTTVTLGLVFDQGTQSFEINNQGAIGKTANVLANIPGSSIIQGEDQDCFSSHVSDATANAISAIDFGSLIASVFPPLLKSIPDSGHLTTDIVYEFAVANGAGEAGLTFPNNNGIAIGVTGTVKYQGTPYPGTPPTGLPVPPAPTDANHLQTYVSAYEINALHWAFFQAGLLNVTINPDQLSDPDVLKVKTYVNQIAAFKPFASFAMQAQVNPNQAPTVSFQTVYILTDAVMRLLKQQLPSNVYQQITGLDGNAYASQAALEGDLTGANVAENFFATIEKAAQAPGMVVNQDLEFTLTIENGAPAQPNLVFDVARTDILQNLALGVSGNAQTMQYAFTRVQASATLVSTTVLNFDNPDFGSLIWPVVGEPKYDDVLTAMGKTGVPLPIMAGFQFLFEQAQLSIQEGFVSVLAQVRWPS